MAVNGYDAYANGKSAPLKAQVAALPARFLPGGVVMQKVLKRSNPYIKEASDTAAQKIGENVISDAFCEAR